MSALAYPRSPSNSSVFGATIAALAFGQGGHMLLTIGIILLILWLLGFFAFHVGSAFIHLVLVIAVIVIILHLFSRR
jgi:hypothetical protein